MEEHFGVFITGRLCILGEHSDWAGKSRTFNPAVSVGIVLIMYNSSYKY
jgi:galactokinase